MSYNGWRNKETWAFYSHAENDATFVDGMLDNSKSEADRLEFVKEYLDNIIAEQIEDHSSPLISLLNCVRERIDFVEIVLHYVPEEEME